MSSIKRDLLHELQAHGAYAAFEPGQLTAIPLAYGIFCAVFDFCMAAYLYATRRVECRVEYVFERYGDFSPVEL